MGHPNLRLALFEMPGLPYALHHAVHDLVDIPAFNPHLVDARFVVARRNRLLDDDRRGGDHDRSRRDDDRRGRDNRRLRHDHRRGTRGIVYGGRDEACAENSGSYPQSLAVLVVVMVMLGPAMVMVVMVVMAMRRGRRTISRLRKRHRKSHEHDCENGHKSVLHDVFLSLGLVP